MHPVCSSCLNVQQAPSARKVDPWSYAHVNFTLQEVDADRWRIFETGLHYDPMLTGVVDSYLRNATHPGIVVDVGSNVGWMALYAASLGHKVSFLLAL